MPSASRTLVIALLAVCVLARPAVAAIVHLADGSRIKGQILRLDSEGLAIETGFAGRIVIAAEAIAGLEGDSPRRVTLKRGESLAGRLRYDPESGRQMLELSAAESRSLERDMIAAIDPPGDAAPALSASTGGAGGPAATAAAPESAPPAPGPWTASSELGLTGASGNTDRINLNGKATARRSGARGRIDLSLQARFAREDGAETENEIIGRGRYERDFSQRWFGFAGLELERDEFEDLDLRSVFSAGAGAFLIKREDHVLKARAGFGYQREAFMSAPTEDEGILSAGYDYEIAVNAWLRFTHSVTVLPSLSDPTEDFRLESEAALDIPVSGDKAWRVRLGLRNHFDNQPVPGNEKLDTFYSVSLAYDFM